MSILDKEKLDEIFEEIETNLEKLSAWERSFIESVRDQWDRTGFLTPNQIEKIGECWKKI